MVHKQRDYFVERKKMYILVYVENSKVKPNGHCDGDGAV